MAYPNLPFLPEDDLMETLVTVSAYTGEQFIPKRVFAAVYMTGILPIKQYGTQSALNHFQSYSMVNPGKLAGYFGFTKEEVKFLSIRRCAPNCCKW